jgi:hypothetical protein
VPTVGVWFRDLRLLPDERLVWQVACNWQQRGTARGGRLGRTPRALIFEPSRLDGLMGAGSRRIPLTDILSVGIESAGGRGSLLGGGIRRRMRLTLTNGVQELLLLNGLDSRIHDVEAAIRGTRS